MCYKEEKRKHVSESDAQIERFLEELKEIDNQFISIRNIAIVSLFKGSGIRSEELINLDIDDLMLDGEKPVIYVVRKGNISDKRIVPIAKNSAKPCLQRYLEARECLHAKNKDEKAVFLSERGTRLTKTPIDSFFKKYSDGLTPHMLRHYLGTLLYNSTGDITVPQMQLGHKNSITTSTFYVNASERVSSIMYNL